ncbi:hypothetical protein OG21DRAFT_1485924 [Imleria badia]|nr:hypothetical protein OG21DRAFT_1485924 [Imleria badia]
MSSGDESVTNDVVSERETQFVYQPGDEDVLWEVKEITAERGKKYKVRWAGFDPATGKPWAQSWVAKHDCTDDLVVAWKAKQKRGVAAGKKKRGGRTSTASRASKRAGSSTSGTKTRRSTSKATSSRVDSVEGHVSSPPPAKPSATKRKRESDTPATVSSPVKQGGAQGESSRPHKKQKTMVEVLLPPLSSDEEGDALPVPVARAKGTVKNKVVPKSNGASLEVGDEDDRSPPKAKAKEERHSEARLKGAGVSARASDVHEESRLSRSEKKAKVVPRRKVRATIVLSAESEDEDLRPPKSKQKLTSKPKLTSERTDALSEKEVESPVRRIKIGPPRGVRRQGTLKASGPSSKPGPSRTKPREDDSTGERVPAEESPSYLDHEVSAFGSPLVLLKNKVDDRTSPSPHISIPKVPPSTPPRSHGLSPGARARLELFDRMMADISQPEAAPPPDVPEHVPEDSHFNFDDIHDVHDAFDTLDPPLLLSPPSSKPKPKPSKPGTPNGLIVPETESSGNSQSQSQPLLKPPSPLPPARNNSPRKPIDLPTIAVIAASASSSASPKDPPQKLPPSTNRPSKRLTFKIAPSTFRPAINARSRVADSEAPPSSIESFASPKRVDKGKQREVEDDQLKSSLSEGESDGERQKRQTQKITDSALKKRGKELSDQAQRAREAEWQKNKKPKRLKPVNEIINGTSSSPSKGSPLPFTSGAESIPEMRLEDVVDLSGGANSATLDSPEHSEAKPLSEEKRERLRIELRQEEEESTQEAMGVYPPPPAKESEVINGEDVQMPPPRSPKFPSNGQIEDVDPVEQPSTDLQLASVIVQASQEQRHEDTDMEPLPANQPTSSPPCPIPEILTDSPGRRLGEALSLLNVKSEEIQRLERELADERKNVQGLKVELAELRQSSEPTGPVRAAWEAERAQWTQERTKWENDLSLWETQRKEMSAENLNLSVRMTEFSDAAVRAEEARVKLSELEAERVAWTKERDVMLNDMVQRSEELAVLTKVRGEDDQDRVKREVERTLWVEEKAGWETERTALQEKQEALLRSINDLSASVESMGTDKVSAEKDRDFFREQYVQASGFVDTVREENVEVEKRVKIAEGQAQEGVAGIRALFEGRVKALQADVARWKGLTELLQEKDRRTNDELRLRAAQAPELIELCGRLNEENKSLEADVRKLGQAQQRSVLQRNKLFYEILLLKKERASLKSKLSKLAKTGDRSTQETSHSAPPPPPILEVPESMDPNDMELLPDPTLQSSEATFDEPALFPCMWRPQWRDQCQQIFDCKEDLERHIQDHFRDLQAQ